MRASFPLSACSETGVSTLIRIQARAATPGCQRGLGMPATQIAVSGGDELLDVNVPVGGNRAAVGQELARVVEENDAVAQQAPPLLGVEGDGTGRVTVWAVSWRTWGLMRAQCLPLGIADVSGLRGPPG